MPGCHRCGHHDCECSRCALCDEWTAPDRLTPIPRAEYGTFWYCDNCKHGAVAPPADNEPMPRPILGAFDDAILSTLLDADHCLTADQITGGVVDGAIVERRLIAMNALDLVRVVGEGRDGTGDVNDTWAATVIAARLVGVWGPHVACVCNCCFVGPDGTHNPDYGPEDWCCGCGPDCLDHDQEVTAA